MINFSGGSSENINPSDPDEPSLLVAVPWHVGRSIEVLTARDRFVARINDYLGGLLGLRDKAPDNPSYVSLGSLPMIRDEIIEVPTGVAIRNTQLHPSFGVTLQGDGESTPLRLQAIVPEANGAKVIRMQGSDPIEELLQEPGYGMRSRNTVLASMNIDLLDPNHPDFRSETATKVTKDGAFRQTTLDTLIDNVTRGVDVTERVTGQIEIDLNNTIRDIDTMLGR